MPIPKILSFDLDNVIRDQIGCIIESAARLHGARLTRKMFSVWDPPLGRMVGLPEEQFTQWAWGCPMIFAESRPLPGVVPALTELIKTHHIIITTATAWPALTEPWLRWWRIPYHTVVHTKDKASVRFDLHIDDSPGTLQALVEQGRPAMRFSLPWNAHLTTLPTLNGWSQATEVFCNGR
ncbi:MAG: hypothetical protein KJ077_10890 [Anaerolineae bacterium]|nr:hypothetical protein [Anaerolineae bacterium]